MRKCFVDMSLELPRWLFLEQRREKNEEHPLCGICFTHHLTEKLCFFFNISQQPLLSICPCLLGVFVCQHYSHMANCYYHDLGSTRARTITRACVLMNMCHIKFALTGRKEESEERNAVGINVELGNPFLQDISCLVERWGPDRELWHSAFSHLGVLQLNTHIFSYPKCVCEFYYHADHTPPTLVPQREQASLKCSDDSCVSTYMSSFSSIYIEHTVCSKVQFSI